MQARGRADDRSSELPGPVPDILGLALRVLSSGTEETQQEFLHFIEAIVPQDVLDCSESLDTGGEVRIPLWALFRMDVVAPMEPEDVVGGMSEESEELLEVRQEVMSQESVVDGTALLTQCTVRVLERNYRDYEAARESEDQYRDLLMASEWAAMRDSEAEEALIERIRSLEWEYEQIDDPTLEEQIDYRLQVSAAVTQYDEEVAEAHVGDDEYAECDWSESGEHEITTAGGRIERAVAYLDRQRWINSQGGREIVNLNRLARVFESREVPRDVAQGLAEAALHARRFVLARPSHVVDASFYVLPFCKQIERWYRGCVFPGVLAKLPPAVSTQLEREAGGVGWTLGVMSKALGRLVVLARGSWPEECGGTGAEWFAQYDHGKRFGWLDESGKREVAQALEGGIGGVTRAAWVALGLEYLRRNFRNGYSHLDHASWSVVDGIRRVLFRPCRLLQFLMMRGLSVPTREMRGELLSEEIAAQMGAVPRRVWMQKSGSCNGQELNDQSPHVVLEYFEDMLHEWRLVGKAALGESGALVAGKFDRETLLRLTWRGDWDSLDAEAGYRSSDPDSGGDIEYVDYWDEIEEQDADVTFVSIDDVEIPAPSEDETADREEE